MNKIDYFKKRAVIVIHEAGIGPGHDLRDYFLQQGIKELLFISHPLLSMPIMYNNSSRYELYKDGKLSKTYYAYNWKLPDPLLYVKDILYTLFWSTIVIGKADIFVGVANINALCGVILRFLGVTKDVIYYVIDYVPNRFRNFTMNTIYHFVDKFVSEQCNWTWNLSPRMIEGREEKWHRKFPNQLVVPHGVHVDRIKRVPFEKINKHEILYMGSLYKKQGIQIVIESLPKVIKKIPHVKFSIIGRGPYEQDLKKLTKKLKLENYVNFLGYMPSHKAMENRIAKAGIAVALYDRTADIYDFTYYADPGKIKNYLGAGVPIILTDVSHVAKSVAKANCGLLVEYNKKDVTKALIEFLSNYTKMREYRKNAITFAKEYRWENIYKKALSYLKKNE